MKMKYWWEPAGREYGIMSESRRSKIVTIRKDGVSSFKVTVTDLVRELNLKEGEQVKITIETIGLDS